jgi:hypothetical protein
VRVNKTRAVVRFYDSKAAGRIVIQDVTVPLACITITDPDDTATSTP